MADVRYVLFTFRNIHLHERRPKALGQQIDLPPRLKKRSALLRSEEHAQLFSMAVNLSESLLEEPFATRQRKGPPRRKRLSRSIYRVVNGRSIHVGNGCQLFVRGWVDDRQFPRRRKSLTADNVIKA